MAEPIASFSVANINPGNVRAEFMLSIMALVEKERAMGHTIDPLVPRIRFDKFYAQHSGPYLDDERNKCVQWFFNDTQSDFLLFIDSDISFDPDQAFNLIQMAVDHRISILSGIYYNSFYPTGIGSLAFDWKHDEELNQPNLKPLSVDELHALGDIDKPHEVGGCGAGFLAISRQCLIDMQNLYGPPLPWFAELVLDGIHMGEDLTFCIRAKYAGHPTYVLPSITVSHFKTCAIRPA